MEERIISAKFSEEDEQVEFSLRPRYLTEYIGQSRAKENLKIYKVTVVTRPENMEKIEQAKQAVAGKLELSMASSHPNNLEFTSIEANKGKAIQRYQQFMNMKFDEIYAFGDGGNDVEQFKVATTSVAMANAPIDVQKQADLITKTNDENGFAYAVHELLKI